jgi:hypothetical protein
LLIVYGLAIAIGAWEVSQRGEAVDLFLDADANYTDALLTLYPDRGESHYAKALQAILCSEAEDQHRPVPATCQQYNSRELIREVRHQFDLGLRTGIKHEQGMYYEYLQFLVLTKAKPSEIERAYQAWRRNFPLSRLPDPRRNRR